MRFRSLILAALLLAVALAPARAFAEQAKSDLTARLDHAAELIDDGSWDQAISILESVLEAEPTNPRALKLYLRANKAKHAAEKRAANVRREVENDRAMKEVDEASRIPEKEITHEPPLKYPKRPKSTISQEMKALLSQPVTLNLADTDLSFVLGLLRDTCGVNIVADRAALEGKRLTVRVDNVRLEDLLDYIALNTGIQYTVNDSGIWITTPVQPQLQIRVFHLRYGVTRTGEKIKENELVNQSDSSDWTPGAPRPNTRYNTRRYYPTYRRFRKEDEDTADNIAEEDVSLAEKISMAAATSASRAQMLSTIGRLMQMRARELANQSRTNNAPGASSRNNNGNGNGENEEADTDMEKLLEWISGWSGNLQWPEGSTWRFDPKTNSLIVVSTPEMLDEVERLINEFDVPPIQVNIRTRFVTVKVQEGLQWGIQGLLESALGSGGDENTKKVQIDPGSGWNLGVPSGSETTGASITFRGVLTDPQYRVVMHALQTQLNGRLLSEPNVTTISNEPARLVVAEQYPYPTDWEPVESTVTNDGATTTNTTAFVPTDFETENVGITLDVMPSVGSDLETIILELHPVIVSRDPNKDAKYNIITTNADGDTESFEVTRPTFSRQEIIAKVVIRSGETVVLGGLIAEEDVTEVNKVPLLGDIPGLGALFRRTVKNKARSNLLIFVTAEIVDTRGRFYHPNGKEENGGRDILPSFVPSTGTGAGEMQKPTGPAAPQPGTEPAFKPKKSEKPSSASEQPSKPSGKTWSRRKPPKKRPWIKVDRPKAPRIGRKK